MEKGRRGRRRRPDGVTSKGGGEWIGKGGRDKHQTQSHEKTHTRSHADQKEKKKKRNMGLAQICLLRFPDLAGGHACALLASVTQSCFSSSIDLGGLWWAYVYFWLTGLYLSFVHGKHHAHCQPFSSLAQPTAHHHHSLLTHPAGLRHNTHTHTYSTRSDPSLPPPPPLSSP